MKCGKVVLARSDSSNLHPASVIVLDNERQYYAIACKPFCQNYLDDCRADSNKNIYNKYRIVREQHWRRVCRRSFLRTGFRSIHSTFHRFLFPRDKYSCKNLPISFFRLDRTDSKNKLQNRNFFGFCFVCSAWRAFAPNSFKVHHFRFPCVSEAHAIFHYFYSVLSKSKQCLQCAWQPIHLILDSPITQTNKDFFAKTESISMVTFSSIHRGKPYEFNGHQEKGKNRNTQTSKTSNKEKKEQSKRTHTASVRALGCMCACMWMGMWIERHPTKAKRKWYSKVIPMDSWIPLSHISNVSSYMLWLCAGFSIDIR